MKSEHRSIQIVTFLTVSILLMTLLLSGCRSSPAATTNSCDDPPTPGCTVFTVAKGDQVFFGGNDDYIYADSWYWVDTPQGEEYGAIWIGASDNVQQGINEKGLAYDANGLPRVETNSHQEREPVLGSYTSYPLHILHECATVEEVIAWVNTHRWHSYMHDQMQFADASGDAVIISAGVDGEIVFTRKPAGDGFLVSTNFNVANPDNGQYPCQRYETATKQLGSLVEEQRELTVEDMAAVLEAVSTPGGSSWTIESLVADLPHGLVYLYYFHQFDQPVVLNVAEEIANPRPAGPLSKLFPEEVRQEATRRYQRILSRQGYCDQIGTAWVGLVLVSLLIMILVSLRKPRSLLYWLPITLLLGPLGPVVWLVAGRKQAPRWWQVAMIEAAGQLPSVTVAFMIAVAVFVVSPQAQANPAILFLCIIILPLFLGSVLYQGPLLALASRRSYLLTLAQRLPSIWIVTNLGFGGMFAVTLPLVNWISLTCSVMNMSIWTLVSVYTAIAIGATMGFLLVLFYEAWSVRSGFCAWSVLATGKGEVNSPSWRKIWWWLLLSFVVLICGIAINSIVQ